MKNVGYPNWTFKIASAPGGTMTLTVIGRALNPGVSTLRFPQSFTIFP
jgi:hypothetical protein